MRQHGDAKSTLPEHRGLRPPWKPGESGNPAGRPKGSRNKLSEEFVAEVYADWCEHGAAAIKTLRETRPDVYVKVLASLLPRQVQAEVTGPTHEERVAELVERLAELDATQASLVRPAARRTGRLGNAGGNRRG